MWRYFCLLLTQVAHYTADGCPGLTNDPRLQPRYFPTQIFYRPRYRIFSIIHIVVTMRTWCPQHSPGGCWPGFWWRTPLPPPRPPGLWPGRWCWRRWPLLTQIMSPPGQGGGRVTRPWSAETSPAGPVCLSSRGKREEQRVEFWNVRTFISFIFYCFFSTLVFVLRWIIIILNITWREEEEENGRIKDLNKGMKMRL